MTFILEPGELSLSDIRQLIYSDETIVLDCSADQPIERSHQVVQEILRKRSNCVWY